MGFAKEHFKMHTNYIDKRPKGDVHWIKVDCKTYIADKSVAEEMGKTKFMYTLKHYTRTKVSIVEK